MRSAMCPALAVVHPPSQGPHPRRGAGNESPKAYVYVLHREARISFLSFFVARSGAIKPTPQGVCTPSGENSSSERRLGRIVLPKGTRVNRKMTGKMTGKCSATCRAFSYFVRLLPGLPGTTPWFACGESESLGSDARGFGYGEKNKSPGTTIEERLCAGARVRCRYCTSEPAIPCVVTRDGRELYIRGDRSSMDLVTASRALDFF